MENKLLFAITTYNDLEYTKICLDSLKEVNESRQKEKEDKFNYNLKLVNDKEKARLKKKIELEKLEEEVIGLDEYKKCWYSDSEGSEEPCTAKATSYCSNMAGSFITNSVAKMVNKQPFYNEVIFHFPSMSLMAK